MARRRSKEKGTPAWPEGGHLRPRRGHELRAQASSRKLSPSKVEGSFLEEEIALIHLVPLISQEIGGWVVTHHVQPISSPCFTSSNDTRGGFLVPETGLLVP